MLPTELWTLVHKYCDFDTRRVLEKAVLLCTTSHKLYIPKLTFHWKEGCGSIICPIKTDSGNRIILHKSDYGDTIRYIYLVHNGERPVYQMNVIITKNIVTGASSNAARRKTIWKKKERIKIHE